MIRRHELGSALHSGSSIQSLSSILEEAVTQCSIMYIGHKAPVADSAASAADPLRQFRGDCGTGAQSQKESYSSGSRDTSGRSDRRRQQDDFEDERSSQASFDRRRWAQHDENDGYDDDRRPYRNYRGYGARGAGGFDRQKHDPFKKWASSTEKIYKGDCYLTEDLLDVTSAPSPWLAHMVERFTLFAIEKRYWVAAALFAVSKEIKDRFIRMCKAADDLLPVPWEGYLDHLARAEVDFDGNLPNDHPMSWSVFSIWLNAEYTDLGLGKKQISFVKNLRQTQGQTTMHFNSNYKLQLERLTDLQRILPLEERERFDSAEWRENYLRSLLAPISAEVRKHLAQLTADLLVKYHEAQHELSFEERMMRKQRINLAYDNKTLELVMLYAAGVDRCGQLSAKSSTWPSARFSSSMSRDSSSVSSRSSTASARASSNVSRPQRRFNQLAIMDDPARQPGSFEAGQEQADNSHSEDEDAFYESPEVFFGQMVSRFKPSNVWTREQIAKLRAKNLCFRCGQPNCMARTCKNTPVNPREFKLNNISLEDPVHFLPEEDGDLLQLLVDYEGSLNEKAPQH